MCSLVAVTLLTAGCAGASVSPDQDATVGSDAGTFAAPSSDEPEPEVAAIAAELCRLATLAGSDPAAAAGAFDHQPLHAVADELAMTDRAAAGRLLEAKARAEALAREADPDAEELTAALADLAARLPDHQGCDL
jgi:hypothetical protein